MEVKIGRNIIFALGFAVVFILLLFTRYDYLVHGTKVMGRIEIYVDEAYAEFHLNGRKFQVSVPFEYVDKGMSEVELIYPNNDPYEVIINRFQYMWLNRAILSLFPLMIFGAIIYSFVSEDEEFVIFSGKKRKFGGEYGND